ncbi:MAG: polyprenyl diphosphate synthase [Promethearchaeota archaeon]
MEEFIKSVKGKLPKHVGIIPDGNRRWARERNLDINFGHLRGYETMKTILYSLFDAGIRYLTIYALSLENARKRSKEELKYIYEIIKMAVEAVKEDPMITEEKVKMNVIGRWRSLPSHVTEKIKELIDYTKDHDKAFINICVMYDGQEEIVDAVKALIKNNVSAEEITPEKIKEHLYTKDFPPVDYIIRTGMDDGARISGFLLWDASYAEFRFRNEYWPDYSEELLIEDLKEYMRRKRRLGA